MYFLLLSFDRKNTWNCLRIWFYKPDFSVFYSTYLTNTFVHCHSHYITMLNYLFSKEAKVEIMEYVYIKWNNLIRRQTARGKKTVFFIWKLILKGISCPQSQPLHYELRFLCFPKHLYSCFYFYISHKEPPLVSVQFYTHV